MRLAASFALVLSASSLFIQAVSIANTPGARALWEPPEWNVPENIKATAPKEMLPTIRVSNDTIVLEQTAMKEVQGRLGGEIGRRGDASEALQWLCYHGSDATGRWILWLESGEIDGDSVGSFQWQRLSSQDVVDARCGALGNGSSIIELPLALKLGATSSDVLEKLGPPTSRNSTEFLYLHEHEVGGTKTDPFVSSNLIMVHFRNHTVWSIQGSKTISD